MALPRDAAKQPPKESADGDTGQFMDAEERAYHEGFMREAIGMAELALRSDETPVGCVFVRDGEIIGRGMNATNRTLNGTRHAEFIALAEILATNPISILKETDLYVTVEPCVMCASALRQYGIRAVYFGCWNDRFGGTGGVLTIHSDPGVDPTFPVHGGIFREEAIMLLRKFYVQENEKAPEPKQKKTRELKTEILPLDPSNPGSRTKKPKDTKMQERSLNVGASVQQDTKDPQLEGKPKIELDQNGFLISDPKQQAENRSSETV